LCGIAGYKKYTMLFLYVFSLRVFIKVSIQEFVYVAVFVAQKKWHERLNVNEIFAES